MSTNGPLTASLFVIASVHRQTFEGGAGLPAPVAVVVLSHAAQNLPRDNIEKSLEATLADTNKHLESHERLSNIVIVDDEWTTDNGLLTPTLKVKRDQLEARYRSVVDRKLGRDPVSKVYPRVALSTFSIASVSAALRSSPAYCR